MYGLLYFRSEMSTYQFVAGDTGSILEITCKNDADNTVIDLTGCTLALQWKGANGVLVSANMTVTDAINGKARYQFLTTELFAGTMQFEVKITDVNSKVIRSLDLLSEKVRRAL